jgi:hypothetical protein
MDSWHVFMTFILATQQHYNGKQVLHEAQEAQKAHLFQQKLCLIL